MVQPASYNQATGKRERQVVAGGGPLGSRRRPRHGRSDTMGMLHEVLRFDRIRL